MPDQNETDRAVVSAVAALTAWTQGLRWADVSQAARHRAALILCDDFAAMVAAREEPELIAYQNSVARYCGRAEATVFNGGQTKLDRCSAALANGGAADWCELDGGYRPVICHAGLYCLPAVFAEAEASGTARVEDVLIALVCGYETVVRVARAFTFPRLVLHPHGSLAAIGAAASVAKLRGLSAEDTAKAISTAATITVPGPYNHAVEGALVRNVWPGLAAQAGIYAADWVGCGISGRPESLADVYAGIYEAKTDPHELTAGLGERFAVEDGYHKLHACCQYGHSAVEAAMEARARLGDKFDPALVEHIHVDTHWKGRTLDNVQPETTLAAKFSMQHIAAAAVRFGHANAEAFHASTLTDQTMSRLRRTVTIGAFEPEQEWPNDRPARITITLADGREATAECLSARGGSDRPFEPSEILAKIETILGPAYPGAMAAMKPILSLDSQALSGIWGETVSAIVGR